MPVKHALGFGNGRIMEHDDGTAGYICSGTFGESFRVSIADITSFGTQREKGKVLSRTFRVYGSGTTLAEVEVSGQSVADRIEQWFRAHPLFRENASMSAGAYVAVQQHAAPADTALSTALIADELGKLAALRDQGVLDEDEFRTAKMRLLQFGG